LFLLLRPTVVAMTRRKALLVVVLVAGGTVVWLAVPQGQRVTEANCKRIHEGMARSEVVEILGDKGDERTRPTADEGFAPYKVWPYLTVEWGVWRGDVINFFVGYDRQGLVVDTQNAPTDPQDVGVVELFRWRRERAWRRFERAWQRWFTK
jgi:hypothetical protein